MGAKNNLSDVLSLEALRTYRRFGLMHFFRKILLLALVAVILAIPALGVVIARLSDDTSRISAVVERYVKAVYARDFANAYQWISSEDRDRKNQQSYVRESGAFTGFTLKLSKQLARFIETVPVQTTVHGERAEIKLELTLPDVERLAPIVMDWDEQKLNSLSDSEQRTVLTKIEQLRKEARLPFTRVQENFELRKEKNRWKIILDSQAGVQIDVRVKLPEGTALKVEPVSQKIAFQPGAPFTISLKLQNSSNHELRARVVHNIEPKSLEKYVGLGDCGTFVPFRLGPRKETENSSTFLIWTDFPNEIKHFAMIYEFEVDRN